MINYNLSKEQLDFYLENGYLQIKNVFSEDFLILLRMCVI